MAKICPFRSEWRQPVSCRWCCLGLKGFLYLRTNLQLNYAALCSISIILRAVFSKYRRRNPAVFTAHLKVCLAPVCTFIIFSQRGVRTSGKILCAGSSFYHHSTTFLCRREPRLVLGRVMRTRLQRALGDTQCIHNTGHQACLLGSSIVPETGGCAELPSCSVSSPEPRHIALTPSHTALVRLHIARSPIHYAHHRILPSHPRTRFRHTHAAHPLLHTLPERPQGPCWSPMMNYVQP